MGSPEKLVWSKSSAICKEQAQTHHFKGTGCWKPSTQLSTGEEALYMGQKRKFWSPKADPFIRDLS